MENESPGLYNVNNPLTTMGLPANAYTQQAEFKH